MAIQNKWKSSLQESELSGSLEMDSLESQIAEAEEATAALGIRSEWTMQRKMGVAMAVVGAILVVVGVAPMVLDSDDLKGSLSESQEEAPDPLVALFGGGATTPPAADTSGATTPDDSLFAAVEKSPSRGGGNPLPVETVSFGGSEDTSIEMEAQPTTVDVVLTQPQGDGQFAAMNLGGTENIPASTSISSEVDTILAEEAVIQNGGSPVNLSNANTGTTDTLGAEFMTENPNIAGAQTAPVETFHGAAGLQNTSVKNTQLTNSGPADMALIMFLVSLFLVGGVRYRKELF